MLFQLGALLLLSVSSLQAQYQRCSKMNEVWKSCSSRCEQTCENPNPSCIKSCGPPSCQCVVGFFRDPRSGECINKNQCDAIMNDCKDFKCSYGYRCVFYRSWPTCVRNGINPSSSTVLKCSSIECSSSKVCKEDTRNGASCEQSDILPPTTCSVMLCPPMTQCTEGDNGASCVPISTDPIPPSGPICSPAAPCPPGMACIEGPYGFECKNVHIDPPRPTYTCDNLKCKDGEYCTESEGFPKCVPAPVDPIPPRGPSCYTQSDCPPGLTCIDTGNGEECAPVHIDPVMPPLTCDNLKCLDGEFCVNEDNGPKCIKAPVDPIPPVRCTRRCRRGQKCLADSINGQVCQIDDGCGPNEVMKKCSNPCFEKNCGEDQFSKQCSVVCGPPKCQCAEGFFRETNSRACVRANQCPPPIEYTTTTEMTTTTTTDYSIPCGDTSCHPAWSCQRIEVPCTRSPCPPVSFFCMAPHTIPPPTCGDQYCSSSEKCDTIKVSCTRPPCPPERKVCVLLPGATSPPAPSLPSSCGPDGMVCAEGETCQVAMAGCSRLPCPPPIYSCAGDAPPTGQPCGSDYCRSDQTCQEIPLACSRSPCPPSQLRCVDVVTSTPSNGPGPSLPPSCATVRCPRGQICRMKDVRCYSGPCPPVPTCQ